MDDLEKDLQKGCLSQTREDADRKEQETTRELDALMEACEEALRVCDVKLRTALYSRFLRRPRREQEVMPKGREARRQFRLKWCRQEFEKVKLERVRTSTVSKERT